MDEPMPLFYARGDLPERIRNRIIECASGCWEWQGARSDGYGRVGWQSEKSAAHRVVYQLLVGPVAADLVLDHLCRNRPCVNPAHLEPVTNLVNSWRGARALPDLPVVVPETDGVRPMLSRPADASECWLPVAGYEGLYEVSDQGRVRSLATYGTGLRGGILKPYKRKDGRLDVALHRDGRQRNCRIHQVVAEAFIGPRPEGMETRHLNDEPADNRLVNLAYGTSAENKQDMLRNGRHFQANMTHCEKGHAFDEANTRWRADGRGRDCRICANERGQARLRKLPEIGKRCTIPDCEGFQIARGLCRDCYTRARAAERRGPDWQDRVCPQCGKPFIRQVAPGQGKRKYCSERCLKAATTAAAREYQRERYRRKKLEDAGQ